jgi:hypothetical protein
MRAVLLAAAFLLAPATATQALPGNVSTFTVQNVAFTPQAPILIDGVNWRCTAENVCVGTGGQSQPASRACRRVVARIGVALASFTYKGTTLTDDELAACNLAAAGA